MKIQNIKKNDVSSQKQWLEGNILVETISLLSDGMMVLTETLKIPQIKLLQLIKDFGKVAEYKINMPR